VPARAHFEIRVDFPQRSAIEIVRGSLSNGDAFAGQDLSRCGVAIVSDANVFPLYGKRLVDQLGSLSARVESVVLPPGEATKSIGCLHDLWSRFAEWNLQRDSLVVAL
jgi:3-dehydroquinate synthase